MKYELFLKIQKLLSVSSFFIFIIFFSHRFRDDISSTGFANPIELIAGWGSVLLMAGAASGAIYTLLRSIFYKSYKPFFEETDTNSTMSNFNIGLKKKGYYFESNWTLPNGGEAYANYNYKMLIFFFIATTPVYVISHFYYDFIKGLVILSYILLILPLVITLISNRILSKRYKRDSTKLSKLQILPEGIRILPSKETTPFNQIEYIFLSASGTGRWTQLKITINTLEISQTFSKIEFLNSNIKNDLLTLLIEVGFINTNNINNPRLVPKK